MSKKLEVFLSNLKEKGFKKTNVRSAILNIFISLQAPISIQDLQTELEKINLNPNKTTLYREIELLKSENILEEIDFGEGRKRYEVKSESCHHHLICSSCKSITCIDMENEVHELVEKIEKNYGFSIKSHMLEFFGLCNKCKLIA